MCPFPIYLKKYRIEVPCGKCGACIKRLISDYTLRLQVEHRKSKGSYFVTLTYEEAPDNISKSDLQKLFKRMRKAGLEFSYFALGDYGDTFGRPHYHVLFFAKGFFPKEVLHRLWTSGEVTDSVRGFVDIKPVSYGRIAYVVKYGFLAKVDWSKDDKRTRPFFLMSRRPAIGLGYLSKDVYFYHVRGEVTHFQDGRYKKPLPRYYKQKIFPLGLRQKLKDDAEEKQRIQRDSVLREISKWTDDPISKYNERIEKSSNDYLANLRKQKLLKNKLL